MPRPHDWRLEMSAWSAALGLTSLACALADPAAVDPGIAWAQATLGVGFVVGALIRLPSSADRGLAVGTPGSRARRAQI